MNEKYEQVLEQAREVYMRLGIKSVTMDDMARELGISKKTLYQHVKDKVELVSKVMEREIEKDQENIQKVLQGEQNAIDELFEISKLVNRHFKQVHPSIIFDLQKYYPEAWNVFFNYKKNFIYNCMVNNLKKGISEGLYRNELSVEIIAGIYISKLDVIFDHEVFPDNKFSFFEIYRELITYHIRGIASTEGIEYLKEKIKKEESKHALHKA